MKQIKTLAIYLPQYHRVQENDEWWGEGYTEWTAVQQAESYYDGHEQPRIPLNENYYDLSQKDTMKWQAELAEKYGIYGFCFFHYYFKDGRKILEKPAENLLAWKDVPMKFCFSWASVSWTQTWSKIKGSAYARKFEKYTESDDGVLLLQQYGGIEEWTEHFEYLLPFFEDDRYIKIDGKPVFVFHNPGDIDCLDEMTECWRKLAEKNGLPGIYLLGNIPNTYQEYPMLDALYAHEPVISFGDYILYSDVSKREICRRYNRYEDVSKWSMMRDYKQNQKMYFGTFVGYDTTPRHGKNGSIIEEATPEAFEKSFRQVCNRSILHGNEFVFINAWNEWAEGNYLEPDEKYRYRYLEAVKKVMKECLDGTISEALEIDFDANVFHQVLEERDKQKNKFSRFFSILDQWMALVEEGKDIDIFMNKHGYKSIAVYGYAALGKHILSHLKGKIEVKYFIDKKINDDRTMVTIYEMNEKLPEVDAIVVTPIHEYLEVERELRSKVSCDIVSLETVIRESV